MAGKNRLFNIVPSRRPKRNVFDLSHEKKLSCNMGELIPILCEEVVPGDTFKMRTEVMLRLAPMLAPMMHRVNVYTHFFFVPNRLLWNNWEDFITGGENGTANPIHPFMYASWIGTSQRRLADYLGVSTQTGGSYGINPINSLPFRAYQLIYDEYYRDQTLQPAIDINKGDAGSAAEALYLLPLRQRCWEKDYFTSALPWTQRGGEVSLPLDGDADIVFDGTHPASVEDYLGNQSANGSVSINAGRMEDSSSEDIVFDVAASHHADLSTVTDAISINELRRATRLQRWLERNARAGSRYIEQILSHFGVKSSDSRLQRPEYLGGGKSPVVVSEVLQTSQTEVTGTAQGNMAGHGISVGNSHQFKSYFEEHGIVMGIISVLPRTTYQQGMRRMFFRSDKFDYYWPEFAHLGEQPVYEGELYADDYDPLTMKNVWGYQSRYSEYKFVPSSVHGDFKSSLNYWHMGRNFSSLPNLNSDFVESDPTHRVFAVTDPDEHKLWIQVYNDLKAIRPMPIFGEPTL